MSELKIEAGRFYETRGGFKAWVGMTECPIGYYAYPVHGYVLRGNIVSAQRWKADGSFANDTFKCEHDYDLIAPWPDEPEEKVIDGVKCRKQLAWVPVGE